MTLIYLIYLLQLTILNERLSQGPAVLSSFDVFIHFVREFFLYFATGMDTYFYLLLPFCYFFGENQKRSSASLPVENQQ